MPELTPPENSKINIISFTKAFSNLIKDIMTSWPASILIIILLFHSDFSAIFNTIPKKLAQASNIDVNGTNFKMAFEKEMAQSNHLNKYKDLKSISPIAIETAISGITNQTSTFLYHREAIGISVVHIPTSELISAIKELEHLGIIKIESPIASPKIETTLSEFFKKNIGYPEKSIYQRHVAWHLATPLSSPSGIPIVNWQLTAYGKEFTTAIVETVARELSKAPQD